MLLHLFWEIALHFVRLSHVTTVLLLAWSPLSGTAYYRFRGNVPSTGCEFGPSLNSKYDIFSAEFYGCHSCHFSAHLVEVMLPLLSGIFSHKLWRLAAT